LEIVYKGKAKLFKGDMVSLKISSKRANTTNMTFNGMEEVKRGLLLEV
jgi:hypothetical protein